eukprot:gene25078-31492_t
MEFGCYRVRRADGLTKITSTIGGTGTSTVSGASTSAGIGDGGAATAATLSGAYSLYLNNNNNRLYIADTGNSRLRVLNLQTNIMTSVAGTGAASSNGDHGAASSASLNAPRGVTINSYGLLYVCEFADHRVRVIDPTTLVITVGIGTGTVSPIGASTSAAIGDNGPATVATLRYPYWLYSMVSDNSGAVYISDFGNSRYRKMYTYFSPTVIPTVAPSARPAFAIINRVMGNTIMINNGDGGHSQRATSITTNQPIGITMDTAGGLYFSEISGARVRAVNMVTTIVTTICGTGTNDYSGDSGPVTSAAIKYSQQIFLDTANNMFIGDVENERIRKFNLVVGIITTIAGTGSNVLNGNVGPATSIAIVSPSGVGADSTGLVYIIEQYGFRVRRVDPATGLMSNTAGTGVQSSNSNIGDGGSPLSATFNHPAHMYVESTGYVYIGDCQNHVVRRIEDYTPTAQPTMQPTGHMPFAVIATVAGTGAISPIVSGQLATSTAINAPLGIVCDVNGTLYIAESAENMIYLDSTFRLFIADTGNNKIRLVHPLTKTITTYAGNGQTGTSGNNGPATSANINIPCGVSGDLNGTIYLNELSGFKIRRVDKYTQIISILAGTGVEASGLDVGDGGSALNARMSSMDQIFISTDYKLYFTDGGTMKVRVIDLTAGSINLVMGTGSAVSTGDNGVATAASLNAPCGVYFDSSGIMYVSEYLGSRIRRVEPLTRIVSTAAGTGSASGGTDSVDNLIGDGGPPTAATMTIPYNLFVSTQGVVYFSDKTNNRVRKIFDYTPTSAPSYHHMTVMSTFAGSGPASSKGDGGPATAGTFNTPNGIWGDAGGNMYIGEAITAGSVRFVLQSSLLLSTLFGGTYSTPRGLTGVSATSVMTSNPMGLAGDVRGDIYSTDYAGQRIRKISSGYMTTIAGTTSMKMTFTYINTVMGNGQVGSGSLTYNGQNVQATNAALYYPTGVFADMWDNVYEAEFSGSKIRKVDINGTGALSSSGWSSSNLLGDGGRATAATFYSNQQVFLDTVDNLYIADSGNYRIRVIALTSTIITSVAGNGVAASPGIGRATSVAIDSAVAVMGDTTGVIYTALPNYAKVMRINVNTGLITVFAGTVD